MAADHIRGQRMLSGQLLAGKRTNMGQKYVAYNSQGTIVTFYDSIDSPPPAGATILPITDAEWKTCSSQVGWTIVSGALTAPNAAFQLTTAQNLQLGILLTAYGAAIHNDVTFTTAGGITKTFQADKSSQDLLMQAVQGYTITGATPSGFYWISTDNTQVPFTLSDLTNLYTVMLSQGWTAFQHYQTQKAAVKAATTIAAVQAVVW